ncbi:MAG: hypothetical protein JO294_00565 [Alphaproteobacteria bacterium]|nr:hypothetical protein [Alphaproteobacteria bacterium]
MSAFDHVLLLLSFVYALALSLLLTRIAALIGARTRVRASGLLLLAMADAIITLLSNWLGTWDYHTAGGWDLPTVVVQFAYAVGIFLFCALAAPDVPSEGVVDLEAYYWQQRPALYWILIASLLLGLPANLIFLNTSRPELLAFDTAGLLGLLVPAVFGLVVRARWAQWASWIVVGGAVAVLTAVADWRLR